MLGSSEHKRLRTQEGGLPPTDLHPVGYGPSSSMHLPQDLEGGPALPPSTQHQPSPGPAPSTGQEVIQAEIVVDVAPLSPREGGPRGEDGAGPPPAFGPPPLSSLARPLEPLSDAALQLLQSQGAAACDQDLRAMRHDDELALLSARRGLQVRFVVKALRTYMPLSEMVVEAPEFATVEYLKRRIFRAKLQRGEYLPASRFVLRKRVMDGSHVLGMDSIPSRSSSGDEVFLFNEGYMAPGMFEVFIQSAPSSGDRERQARMPVLASPHAAQDMPLHLVHLDSEGHASFRQMLQSVDPGMGYLPAGAQTMVEPRQSQEGMGMGLNLPMAHGSLLLNQQFLDPAYISGEEQPGAQAGGSQETRFSARNRRQTGRWGPDEVQALIEGVREMGTSWTQIHTAYVRSGRINERRTQMDLKDKWRNLVRLVTHPGRHSRGAELSNDQRQLILGIVFRPPDAGGDPPASSPGNSSNAEGVVGHGNDSEQLGVEVEEQGEEHGSGGHAAMHSSQYGMGDLYPPDTIQD
uniref:Uncharacterized protein n=1 Tax=Auxenochlorella protothecoides TaxID=3075 RepID=A0A1D2A8J9_AUXPR